MGILAHVLRSSGLTHGSPPPPTLFLSTEVRRLGTHDTKPHQLVSILKLIFFCEQRPFIK
jgi:hypothetical protein